MLLHGKKNIEFFYGSFYTGKFPIILDQLRRNNDLLISTKACKEEKSILETKSLVIADDHSVLSNRADINFYIKRTAVVFSIKHVKTEMISLFSNY